MYETNTVSSARGCGDGGGVNATVGVKVGVLDDAIVGTAVGTAVGTDVGVIVGLSVGVKVGPMVGETVVICDGIMVVGLRVGNVGSLVGPITGALVGAGVRPISSLYCSILPPVRVQIRSRYTRQNSVGVSSGYAPVLPRTPASPLQQLPSPSIPF